MQDKQEAGIYMKRILFDMTRAVIPLQFYQIMNHETSVIPSERTAHAYEPRVSI